MKDSPISKLLITKTGYRPTQYKKIVENLHVLCVDKNYQRIDDVTWTRNDLVERDFMPPYLKANQWSISHHVKIITVNPTNLAVADGSRPLTFETLEQTHAFDANVQKELQSEYKQDSKNKSLEYSKFLTNKKVLITIIFGQYNKATKQQRPKFLLKQLTQRTAKQEDSLSSSSNYL